MKPTATKLVLPLMASLVLSIATAAHSAERLVVAPKLAASWIVDSNYFLTDDSDNEVEVYTYLVQPGFELGIETPKSSLSLNYSLDAYFYDKRDDSPPGQREAQKLDSFPGQTFGLESRYSPSSRLLLGLDDSFYYTRDPGQTDTLQNTILRDKYWINRFEPLAFYELGRKFTAGLRYRNTIIDYRTNRVADSTENRGIFDLIYNFTPRTSLDLEAQYWVKDYEGGTFDNSDYDSYQLGLIFRRRFRILAFEAGAGWQKRDFDQQELGNESTAVYRVALEGEKGGSGFLVSAERNFNDQGLGNLYYKATRITVAARHLFTRRIFGELAGYFQYSDYENLEGVTQSGSIRDREDKTYDIAGTAGYKFTEWMNFSVTGGYENRDSNLRGLDYENKYFIARIAFVYNLREAGFFKQ